MGWDLSLWAKVYLSDCLGADSEWVSRGRVFFFSRVKRSFSKSLHESRTWSLRTGSPRGWVWRLVGGASFRRLCEGWGDVVSSRETVPLQGPRKKPRNWQRGRYGCLCSRLSDGAHFILLAAGCWLPVHGDALTLTGARGSTSGPSASRQCGRHEARLYCSLCPALEVY